MTYEEHIEHFKNWYVNHKDYSKWQKLLDEYEINNEDIVLQYAKETNVIETDEETIDYWTYEFDGEEILI
jgi:hypothetical protein